MLLFVPWDIAFTHNGVWGFNHTYTQDCYVFNLPLEEWLFFLVIPVACVFVYEVLNHYRPFSIAERWVYPFYIIYGIAVALLALFFRHQAYTFYAGMLTAVMSIGVGILRPHWAANFLRMYIIIWIPFILINGILTGMLTENPVVYYHPDHIIGLRIISIPVEDSIYNFAMLAMVVAFYHWLPKQVQSHT
jgi:lycopene cyclase domain-containing protein